MVYLRAKKVKSDQYLYLVKSAWNKEKNTSRQVIVKYLGKASKVAESDIPDEYRANPKIIAALSTYNPDKISAKGDLVKRSRRDLYRMLLDGMARDSERVCKNYVGAFGAGDFFERVLKPVMYEIGDGWEAGKVSIAVEHVASNIAQTLVRETGEEKPTRPPKSAQKVLICVPAGEEHRLGCDMLEAVLSRKGFVVFNMGAPAPAKSILDFVDASRPDCVLLSVTLCENVRAGQRLVQKMRRVYGGPILVGGRAFESGQLPEFQAEIVAGIGMDQVAKKIRACIAK